MRNKRLLFVLVGAVVFGLFAAVSVSRYLSNAQATPRNMQSVVVAKVDIPLGTKVVASGQNRDRPTSEREADTVKAVTLQVTPGQAEKLALASTEGKLRLVLRNTIDQDDEQTPGANKQSLLGGEHAAPAPEAGSL